MAIRVAVNRVCDRCMRPFDIQNVEYGTAVPSFERTPMKLVRGDHVVFEYSDLCTDCTTAVDNYLDKIDKVRLDSEKRKKRGEKEKDRDKDKEAEEVLPTKPVSDEETALPEKPPVPAPPAPPPPDVPATEAKEVAGASEAKEELPF